MSVLIIGIILGATYGGYTMSKRYIEREKFFLEFKLFCDRLSSEIRFSQNTLSSVFFSFSIECKSYLKVLIEKYSQILERFDDTTEESLRKEMQKGILKNAEFDITLRFFSSLGRGDTESELKTIEGYKSAIIGFYDEAAAEKKRYASLYTKLGFLAGLVISILIV